MDKFEEVLPKLVQIQLFSDFNPDDENDIRILRAVYDSMVIENYQKGDVIIEEGKFGDMFYILYKGKVKVFRKTPAGDKIALADLSSDMNIFFGETALISDDPRTATVQASTDCRCIALSSTKFLDVYRVLLKLAQRMAKTIRDTNSDKATLYEALFSEIESGV